MREGLEGGIEYYLTAGNRQRERQTKGGAGGLGGHGSHHCSIKAFHWGSNPKKSHQAPAEAGTTWIQNGITRV